MVGLDITIWGVPIAKKRPRFARHGKHVVTYNEQETEEGRFLLAAREQIKQAAKEGGFEVPIQSPVDIFLQFHLPRPKKHYGTGKNSEKLKPSAPVRHITTPDIDNLVKFALDCLNGEAWADDRQICSEHAYKVYAGKGRARTVIFIAPSVSARG